jgi:hypothetical protein
MFVCMTWNKSGPLGLRGEPALLGPGDTSGHSERDSCRHSLLKLIWSWDWRPRGSLYSAFPHSRGLTSPWEKHCWVPEVSVCLGCCAGTGGGWPSLNEGLGLAFCSLTLGGLELNIAKGLAGFLDGVEGHWHG